MIVAESAACRFCKMAELIASFHRAKALRDAALHLEETRKGVSESGGSSHGSNECFMDLGAIRSSNQ